jgi:ribosomal protein S18 acetylase RimI-like enzyme
LLAFDGDLLVGVLLGSVSYPQREPNKRPLSKEGAKSLETLRVRLPGGDCSVTNAYIAVVSVADVDGLDGRLVSLFVRFCGGVYGALSFTTEIPDGDERLLQFYKRQRFRIVGRQTNRFAEGEGCHWLERDLLLEDAIETPPQRKLSFSPFVLLEADYESSERTINANFERLSALRSPHPEYYEELREARALLLRGELRDELITELFPKHAERGAILYDTCELTSLDIVTKRSHEFQIELPGETLIRFSVSFPVSPALLDGFLIPGVNLRHNLPDDPGYHIAVRLKERPFKGEVSSQSAGGGCPCRVFRRFDGAFSQKIPDVYIEHIVPLAELQRPGWYNYRVPLDFSKGQWASLAEFIAADTTPRPPPVTPPEEGKKADPPKKGTQRIKETDERIADRMQVWSTVQRQGASVHGKPTKKGAVALALPDDRRAYAALFAESVKGPVDAFQLNHPYRSPRPAGQLAGAFHLFRAQANWCLSREQTGEGRTFKVRSIRSEKDIPRIMDLVRSDGPDLFGHSGYRAFIAAAPLASFVCLADHDEPEKPRPLAGMLVGSVRHSSRRREAEPPELEALRIRQRATDEPIVSMYIALVKEDPRFKGFKVMENLIRVFIEFCINVYAATCFTCELAEDDEELMAIYEDFGFRRIKRMPRYYPDGKGAFWIEKNRIMEWHSENQPKQ